jgi:glycine reductase complex component B subunit gamma
MDTPVRVVHYVNQFFAGVGGEEAANRPLEVRREPAGPTRALMAALGDRGTVIATLVGGDNYMNDQRESAREALDAALRELAPDVVIAGPAFEAGRYSLACAEVCRAAAAHKIAAVTAMHPSAPAATMYRRELLIVPTGSTATDMPRVLPALARLALKVASGEALGPAEVEGYLPRGVRKSAKRAAPGYLRALDMLEAKLGGRPFASEIPYQAPEAVAPAPPLADLRRAEIALVTTGGLVPKGNPDGQTSGNAQKYFRYPIDQLQALRSGEWEAYHVGYFTHLVDKNPNYVLPLGYMRELEKEGLVGAVHRYAYTLPGVSTPVATARRLGEGIAAQLREGQVGGCLLVST